MVSGPWSDAETEILRRDNAAGISRIETAAKLGRAYQSVLDKAKNSGISLSLSNRGRPGPDDETRARWKKIYPRVRDAFLADIAQDVA